MAAPNTWAGTLNANEIFTSLFNMIISQQVFTKNISGTYGSLASRAMQEGSLYGDTKLYYSTDILETFPYEPDSSRQLNVLETHRPKDPHVQAITVNQFRWIPITIDSYLSKRPYMTERVFSDFNSVCLQWLRDTREVYFSTTYNAFIGTEETSEGSQQQVVDLSSSVIPNVSTTVDKEAYYRLIAEAVAEKLSNLRDEMKDISRTFNDLGYTRSIDPADMVIIWNAKWANLLRKVGMPTIFHKDGLLEIKDENVLPSRYFGARNSSQKTADAQTRSLVEQTLNNVHYWAGDAIATGVTVPANKSYQEASSLIADGTVICKIMHKDSIPLLAGFETETEFINPKNRSENHYLHFGHNTLQHIYNYPLITVKVDV